MESPAVKRYSKGCQATVLVEQEKGREWRSGLMGCTLPGPVGYASLLWEQKFLFSAEFGCLILFSNCLNTVAHSFHKTSVFSLERGVSKFCYRILFSACGFIFILQKMSQLYWSTIKVPIILYNELINKCMIRELISCQKWLKSSLFLLARLIVPYLLFTIHISFGIFLTLKTSHNITLCLK